MYLENTPYLKDDKSDQKNFVNFVDFSLITILFITYVFIQFSSHHYETIDWDINAYLITSLDIGRGNLPLENQFENKPPLIFLFYYLFSLIGNGDLLPIKILNDLVLFLSVFVLYFLVKNLTQSKLEPFFCSLAFVLFTSNYWFHPGFSEIFSLLFISLSYLFIAKKHNKTYKYIVSGFIFGLSTLVNIGTLIFFIGFSIIVLLEKNKRLVNFLGFVLGLGFVQLFTLLLYLYNNLLNEYLISVFFIPISYAKTDFNFAGEFNVFLTSLYEYNIFVYVTLAFATSNLIAILIKNLYYKNNDLEIRSFHGIIFFLNSFLFYYFAAKGYYHHLFFALFFVAFGISKIPKNSYKFLLYAFLTFGSFQVLDFYVPQTLNNFRNFSEIENNYPVKKVSNLVKNEINEPDTILSIDNILILYYLDRPNMSYIVHPALYNYEEIFRVLKKYNKVQDNEISFQISKNPKIIEGYIEDSLIKNYYKLPTELYLNEYINFYDRKKNVEIYIRDN